MKIIRRSHGARAGLGVQAVVGVLLLVGSTGCERETVHVYRVPKESHQLASAQAPTQSAEPRVHWVAPKGWQEVQASGIRAGQFAVPSTDNLKAEVAVIPLQGAQASELEIVNLWRQQIGLSSAEAGELEKLAQAVTIGPLSGKLYDMLGTQTTTNGAKVRMLIALAKHADTTWVFKMNGEDAFVEGQKPTFVEFLQTVHFTQAPPAMASGAGAGPTAASEPQLPEWTLPSHWQQQPPSTMLLAKFTAGDASNGQVEITVSAFPGDVGGFVANVNRWRRQVGLDPVSETEAKQAAAPIQIDGLEGTVVDLTGQRQGQPVRLIGVILPRGGQTWFFKLMGDAQTAEKEKPTFLKWAQSVRFKSAGSAVVAATKPAAPAAPAAPPEPGQPRWTAPSHWQQQPPSTMLLAKFTAGDASNGQVQITVSAFPGDVGGFVANVNRWRRQVGLDPVSETEAKQAATPIQIDGLEGTVVDLTGQRQGQPVRLIGVILPRGGQTWFFKLMGEAQAAEKEKAAFFQFLKSVDFPNA